MQLNQTQTIEGLVQMYVDRRSRVSFQKREKRFVSCRVHTRIFIRFIVGRMTPLDHLRRSVNLRLY